MIAGTARAQALLELSLCAPVVVLLALGTAATVQIASARAGLDAATQAAANAAVRAPEPTAAVVAAQQSFTTVVADYPLRSPTLSVSMGGFSRAGKVTVSSSAHVDLRWAAFLLVPNQLTLRSQVVLWLEPWRTHTTAS